MNRSYNFQVDNGLFIAEYYLEKDYKDITIEDLRDNVELLAGKMKACNDLTVLNSQKKKTHLSTSSHNNSALTQTSKKFKSSREQKIKEQLSKCLDLIADHKTCMICGERLVSVAEEINSSMMYGIASSTSFINKSSNLKHVDVCGKCLFLSYLSFLNTQKISYPFLYNSDSDEFMRDTTEQIQDSVNSSIILDLRQSNSSKHLIDTLLNVELDKGGYDANYIDLVYYKNAQNNYYEVKSIDKHKLTFLMSLKHEGLIGEFVEMGVFNSYAAGEITPGYLVQSDKDQVYILKCSKELYKMLEGEMMTKTEIEMVEYAAEKLLEQESLEKVLKDIRQCGTPSDFEMFMDRYSEGDVLLYRSNVEYLELRNMYKYKNFLIANLRLLDQRQS